MFPLGHHFTPTDPSSQDSMEQQPPLKPAIKLHAFQDPSLQKQSLQDHSLHSSQKQPFHDHSPQTIPVSQDHFTTADVHDIITIKKALPKSFDQLGNMPPRHLQNMHRPFNTASSSCKEKSTD